MMCCRLLRVERFKDLRRHGGRSSERGRISSQSRPEKRRNF